MNDDVVYTPIHNNTYDPDAISNQLLHDNNITTRNTPPIPDLDVFLRTCYLYYTNNGFICCILNKCSSLIILLFTIIFSTFLLLFIDWSALLSCRNEQQCTDSNVIMHNIFDVSTISLYQGITIIYFILLCTYWVYKLLQFISSINILIQVRTFYNQQLHIPDNELNTIEWYIIAEKIVYIQDTNKLSNERDLTVLDITNRIMRVENYMIALCNLDIFDLVLPGLTQCTCSTSDDTPPSCSSIVCNKLSTYQWSIYGTVLDWNIRFCLFNNLFDSQYNINPTYLGPSGVQLLQSRMFMLGIINLLLLPFIMLFLIMYWFLSNAEELHSQRQLFDHRQWCVLAQWKLREFNELKHIYDKRIYAAHNITQLYVQQFPSTVLSILAKLLAYISGSFVAALLILTFSDSVLLVSYRIYDQPLFWYLAIFSTVLAIARSCISNTQPIHQPATLFGELVKFTHYYPHEWRGKTHTHDIHHQISAMYKPRIQSFLYEVCSVLCTPIMLCCSLPRSAARIIEFIESATIHVDGVGSICTYAQFDLDKYGDIRYSNDIHDTSITQSPHKHSSTLSSKSHIPTMKQGKLEKSVLNFVINHPHWQIDSNIHDDINNSATSKFLSNITTIRSPHSINDSMLNTTYDMRPHLIRKLSGHIKRQTSQNNSNHMNINTRSQLDIQRSLSHADSDTTDDTNTNADNNVSLLLTQSNANLIRSFADMYQQHNYMQRSVSAQSINNTAQLRNRSSYNHMMNRRYHPMHMQSSTILHPSIAEREEYAGAVDEQKELFALLESKYDINTSTNIDTHNQESAFYDDENNNVDSIIDSMNHNQILNENHTLHNNQQL